MGIRTSVTITRGQAVIATGVRCQIDNINDDAAVDHGEIPVDYFRWITNIGVVPLVAQGDLLTDEQNIDPLTLKNVQYRVRGQIDLFTCHHVEAKISHPRTK